jgi:signal transduction histidine kinase
MIFPLLLWSLSTIEATCPASAQELPVGDSTQIITNAYQFQTLSAQQYIRGCAFSLTGTVTMVDTNRDLLVLQDATGAIAVNLTNEIGDLQPGQLISLTSENGSPYVPSFPDYPYRPAGWDMQTSFEAPVNWGNYHLQRMRGYLHPPASGEYTFWIASDNSGELWLSSDDDPGNVRRIALLRSGEWVDQREWSRYPWQQSDPVYLQGRTTYYIEAFEEQLTLDDNLSIAWQGPGISQSVIEGQFLSPYIENTNQVRYADTANILREYWTNYTIGSLDPITGSRAFTSALSGRDVHITILGEGTWPKPKQINPDQELPPEDNFRWVELEGAVTFTGNDTNGVTLELSESGVRVQVHVLDWRRPWPSKSKYWIARVQGVCEGVLNDNAQLAPGTIWVPTDQDVSFIEGTNIDWSTLNTLPSLQATAAVSSDTNNSGGGFLSYLSMRGTVTFNDTVLGRDCLFIQDDTAGIFISQDDRRWGDALQVGEWATFGGNVQQSKDALNLHPLLEWTLGWRPMPVPSTDPVGPVVAPSRDGQWTELEGVIRSINTNGTMILMGKGGPVSVWIGHGPAMGLDRYLDSTLRLRGVLSLSIWDHPMLLVPSSSFVDEEERPAEVSEIPVTPIANLTVTNGSAEWVHRVRVQGTVVYKSGSSLFVQDASGGIRVTMVQDSGAQIGDSVEVVGYPGQDGSSSTLTESIVSPVAAQAPVLPRKVDLSNGGADKYNGNLVRVEATLLVQKTTPAGEVLELQQGQNIFEAVSASAFDRLPLFVAGSLLDITGVLDTRVGIPSVAKGTDENIPSSSILIRLRSPADVVLLEAPPKWTLKKVAITMSMVVALLLAALLQIYLSRRRLEQQQITQSAFSRQILQSQESERGRIAANLHDSLGQSLLVIKNQAQLAMQSAKDEPLVQQRLDEISVIASQAVEEVRQITHNLRPYQLDRLGLAQAIRAIVERAAENCPIVFASHVDDIDGIFGKESEIHVYRIVQECLNNIIKHSGAIEAAVVIKKQTATVSMSFRDNGRGFDTGQSDPYNAGFGLGGIAERTKILGGKLLVESQPGKGTNLTVLIPITNLQT